MKGENGGTGLVAPFPYYGSKRRLAPTIWEYLGDPVVYAEPFAGSLACLLSRPGGAGPREIVCDSDGGLCNWWRAVSADPDAVAAWADYPTIHQDLTARHRWLHQWLAENRERLSEDPHFYDAKAAGWWVWGISLWIGGGWCQPEYRDGSIPRRMPHVDAKGGGSGVSTQRGNIPGKMPHVDARGGGSGVSAQRRNIPDKIPHVTKNPGGQGVSMQKINIPDKIPHVADQSGSRGVSAQRRNIPNTTGRLVPWFRSLQRRMQSVVVLNRGWESALTPSLLMHTATAPKPSVGILLDPPYATANRHSEIYGSDADGTSDDAARTSWAWALENGARFRIAYCCHEGDVKVPDGWHVHTQMFAGIRDADRRQTQRNMVLFSPACLGPPQPQLFAC